MEPEKALPVALVVSKSLRRWVLRGAGAAALAGLLMFPFDLWAVRAFKFLQHSNDLVALVLVLTPIGLIILSGALFGVWARAAILAKIYRRAAEDGRDVAQELGFMSRDE